MTATDQRPGAGLERPGGRRRWVTVVIALVTVVAAVVCVVLLRAGQQQSQAVDAPPPPGIRVSRDLDGNRVEWEAEPDLGEAAVTPTGGRFAVPRLGLDVPLLATSVVDGVVTPPTFTDAFVVRQYGTVEDAGSGLVVVVAVHAVRGGRGPGNALLEPARRPHRPQPAEGAGR